MEAIEGGGDPERQRRRLERRSAKRKAIQAKLQGQAVEEDSASQSLTHLDNPGIIARLAEDTPGTLLAKREAWHCPTLSYPTLPYPTPTLP